MSEPIVRSTLRRVRAAAACSVLAAALVSPAAATSNLLVNPGFEADATFGGPAVWGATGWNGFVNAWTTTSPAEPVRSGNGALRLTGVGGITVPGAFQSFVASPGEIWDFSGYLLTPAMLPTDVTFGLLKIVWSDGTNFLPPGVVNVGVANFVDPGIESVPKLDSSSPASSWQFTQAQGVAPAGTQIVYLFALFVDQSPGVAYVDDLAASVVPEPQTLALMALGLVAIGLRRARG